MISKEFCLMGKMTGRTPPQSELFRWAKTRLHSSLSKIVMREKGFFEIHFTHVDGRIHTLATGDFWYNNQANWFQPWCPYIQDLHDLNKPTQVPIWVQVGFLTDQFRDPAFLTIVGSNLGEVLQIDMSGLYASRTWAPCIRVLVRDYKSLPRSIRLPRIDGPGEISHPLFFSGLPDQCNRCRSMLHQVRDCPQRRQPDLASEDTRDSPVSPNRNDNAGPRSPSPQSPSSFPTTGKQARRIRYWQSLKAKTYYGLENQTFIWRQPARLVQNAPP